jgi:hypothetical protein
MLLEKNVNNKEEVIVDEEDVNRERMTPEKLIHGIRLLFSRDAHRTIAKVESFMEIDFE